MTRPSGPVPAIAIVDRSRPFSLAIVHAKGDAITFPPAAGTAAAAGVGAAGESVGGAATASGAGTACGAGVEAAASTT